MMKRKDQSLGPVGETNLCLCGCGRPVTWSGIGRQPAYFEDACRLRAFRARRRGGQAPSLGRPTTGRPVHRPPAPQARQTRYLPRDQVAAEQDEPQAPQRPYGGAWASLLGKQPRPARAVPTPPAPRAYLPAVLAPGDLTARHGAYTLNGQPYATPAAYEAALRAQGIDPPPSSPVLDPYSTDPRELLILRHGNEVMAARDLVRNRERAGILAEEELAERLEAFLAGMNRHEAATARRLLRRRYAPAQLAAFLTEQGY